MFLRREDDVTRFKELKRIESAIKNKNIEDLKWAEKYVQMWVSNLYEMHPAKIAKKAEKEWKKILSDVIEAMSEFKS